MIPDHHVPDDVLAEYVFGWTTENTALVTATHLALCVRCRQRVAQLETIGGELLEATDNRQVSPRALDVLLESLDQAPPPLRAPPPEKVEAGSVTPRSMPEPLRSYAKAARLEDIAWRETVAGKVWEHPIALVDRRGTLILTRFEPPWTAPQHGHQGLELVMPLCGGFRQGGQSFARGDVAVAHASDEHEALIDPGSECICLISKDEVCH
ncbi:MAG: hypothetical protein JRI23_29660 [Deltaproteobacteria bacterium]|jgi:putative transcriptional regulator|nr:hypothetical protein [Deltaproteobacteria bacterium]MBW2536317.1 hypothetical protein [Deltaproteobacteria bacterium]